MTIVVDLPKHSGEASWTLPAPARYVMDSGGTSRAHGVNSDYTSYLESEKIIVDMWSLT